MSQNPHTKKEKEKYKFSIPSRERILIHLMKKKEFYISRKALITELNICGKEQLKGFSCRLRAMVRDGQIIFSQKKYYIPEHFDLLQGTVIGHRDGFGFLRVQEDKNDYYLSHEQMRKVIHGDIVTAYKKQTNRKERREACIIRIIVPKSVKIIGRFITNFGNYCVLPEDSRFNFNIFIPHEDTYSAYIGWIVAVELLKRPTYNTQAVGKIVEILGEHIGVCMAINIALRTYDIPHVWPQEVKNQLNSIKSKISEYDKIGRIDLRKIPFVTVDKEDAHDFDDVVYCKEILENGKNCWVILVAVADVSYYVRPYTPLDKEAQNRATSIYFPSKVIPMLPEKLSNGLCSLNPKVDRLCLVCEMRVSYQGQIISYKFYEAIMNSHAKLTYNIVWQILQGNNFFCKKYSSFVTSLTHLYKMYKILEQVRLNRGGIIFEKEEIKFIFDKNQKIERIELDVRNPAHKLIEECMILANISAALFIEKNKEPAPYRVHDSPDKNHVTILRNMLKNLGLTLKGGDAPKPKDYANLIQQTYERKDYETLQLIFLRSMKQAIYDLENRGHFGLALNAYTHFTSPIRRYPDLLLHRSIKHILAQKNNNFKKQPTLSGGWHYELEEIKKISIQCSANERRADEATRDVSDWIKCDFMKNYIGSIFAGKITNIINVGFFVRINKFFIDGLVHISSLRHRRYYYDNINKQLISMAGYRTYKLGDEVEILVESVHINERKLFFSVTSNKKILNI